MDAVIIRGIDAPVMVKYVTKVFKAIVDINTLSCSSPTNLDNPFCNTLPTTSAETYPTPSTASQPLSISRCGEQFLPYMFHSLKHGKATPNSMNDCSGMRLSLSDDPIVLLESFYYSEGKCHKCRSYLHTTGFFFQLAPHLGQAIDRSVMTVNPAPVCPPADMVEDDSAGMDLTIESGNKRKKYLLEDEDYTEEWEEYSLKTDWMHLMREYQNDILPITEIEEQASNWFQYLPNDEDKKNSKYNCKICSKYYSKYYLKRKRPDMAKEEGTLKRTLGENRREILKHESSATHQVIIDQLKKEKQYHLKNEVSMLEKEDYALVITNKHLRMAYLEAKLNIGFINHEKLCQLLMKHNVDLGFQCCTPIAVKNMVLSIRYISDLYTKHD